jgi:ParB/RepB/Spo0J family partition protein
VLHANRSAGPSGVAALGRVSSGGLVQLPLDQLEPNPWQYRSEDQEWVEELAASLAEKGQIEAITFRTTADGKRQIIGGHTRWLALKLLRERAGSAEEKARFSTILANEKTAVSDEQMEEFGIIDNLLRKDPSIVDTARAIADFQERYQLTLEDLARRFTLERDRAKRLLALHRASDKIKRGVGEGLMVQLYDEEGRPAQTPQGRPKREHRHLDLMQALELASLQAALERAQPKRAAKRIDQLITRILEEGWTFRQVQAECRKEKDRLRAQPAPEEAADGSGAQADGEGRGEEPRAEAAGPVLFRWQDEGRLLVYAGRVGAASQDRRAALRAELEKVLAALK